ncbi:MAG TPA: hypothetical protein DCS93_13450 [Microscillaceae bacterium]|nr:hypothetical protein [Microscillaceae bacterium]
MLQVSLKNTPLISIHDQWLYNYRNGYEREEGGEGCWSVNDVIQVFQITFILWLNDCIVIWFRSALRNHITI